MREQTGSIIYSPSDLIRFLESPFCSWLDRYYFENPGSISPDRATEEDFGHRSGFSRDDPLATYPNDGK
jgi:hypothetical protein